jgi:hypothetical protein
VKTHVGAAVDPSQHKADVIALTTRRAWSRAASLKEPWYVSATAESV